MINSNATFYGQAFRKDNVACGFIRDGFTIDGLLFISNFHTEQSMHLSLLVMNCLFVAYYSLVYSISISGYNGAICPTYPPLVFISCNVNAVIDHHVTQTGYIKQRGVIGDTFLRLS